MRIRSLIFLGFFSFSLSVVNAQKITESKVPKDVVISFNHKYPNAEISSWEMNNNIYVSRFKLNDQEGQAEFNDKGVWNLTRYGIKEKELPTPIINYYNENYRKNEFVISTSELHKNNKEKTFYFIQVKKEGQNQVKPVELTFDLNGKLLSKTDPDESKEKELRKDKKDNKEEIIIQPDVNRQFIVDAVKVPQTAKSHFASKVKKATPPVWYFQDKIYTAKYSVAGKQGQSTYNKDGSWIETRQEMSEETLHQAILSHLKNYYKNYKIKSVEMVSQGKDKSIFIQVFDKKSKQVPPPLTDLWFSTLGKFISVTKPEEVEVDDFSIKNQEDKDKEFLEEVDKKNDPYENSNNYNDKVSFKELPSPIPQYLKQNYKEHLVLSSRLVSDDELGNVYFITVKLENSKYPVHLYFDLQGKWLKTVDEAEGKIKKENSQTIEHNKVSKTQQSNFGNSEEEIEPADLPTNISKYIKKNYPQHSISESYLKNDDEEGNCYLLILKKSGEKKVVKLLFDLDGNMLKNETENL